MYCYFGVMPYMWYNLLLHDVTYYKTFLTEEGHVASNTIY